MNSKWVKVVVAIIPLLVILLVPVMSLIAAHSPMKTETAIPISNSTISPCHEAGYNAGTITANGLVVTAFDTPPGKIKVILPDDMAAGDTVSGTVVVEPAGNSQSERDTNETELNGYVIDIGSQKKPASGHMISFVVPVTLTITLIHGAQSVATLQVPVSTTPLPALNKFTLPTGGQQGRNIEIKGPFNGVFVPGDSVKIGGTTAPAAPRRGGTRA